MANYNLHIVDDTETYHLIQEEVVYNIEVIDTEKLLISDLPDNIPLSKISGLDAYLDEYEFDCGDPLPP
jgi:hypothetical protein